MIKIPSPREVFEERLRLHSASCQKKVQNGIRINRTILTQQICQQVVDMFGCGLPVFTAAYPCISELVQDGINGLHFSSAKELGQQLVEAFHNFPRHNNSLRQLRQAVLGTSGKPTWESEWERVVLPVFTTEEQAKVE